MIPKNLGGLRLISFYSLVTEIRFPHFTSPKVPNLGLKPAYLSVSDSQSVSTCLTSHLSSFSFSYGPRDSSISVTVCVNQKMLQDSLSYCFVLILSSCPNKFKITIYFFKIILHKCLLQKSVQIYFLCISYLEKLYDVN